MFNKRTRLKGIAQIPEWVVDVEHASIAWCNAAATALFVKTDSESLFQLPAISAVLKRRFSRFLQAHEKGPTAPITWTFQCINGHYYDCFGKLIFLGAETYGIKAHAVKRETLLRGDNSALKKLTDNVLIPTNVESHTYEMSALSFNVSEHALIEHQASPKFLLPVAEFSQLSVAVFDDNYALIESSSLFDETFSCISSFQDIFVLNADVKKALGYLSVSNSNQKKTSSFIWEARLQTCQGTRWHQLELHYEADQGRHYLSLLDLHDLRAQQNSLFKLQYYDPLTDLPNRRLLYQELELLLQNAEPNPAEFGVLYLGLDGFKVVNDSFGHRVGDELIVQVARRLLAALPPGARLFRLGGDEFALLQEGINSVDELEVTAQSLMRMACATYPVAEMEMLITASIGIAHYPSHGLNMDTLLQRADVAMYRAKSVAHNTYKVYDEKMTQSLDAYITLGGGLRRALENQEFELYYQPKVRLTDQSTVGAEALIRWQHPELGMISPDQFIPIAEETGLILPLGEWVIRSACRQLEQWRLEGFKDVSLSVNLSGRQFMQADLVRMVQDVLSETGVDPSKLEFELTESMLMVDAEQTIDKLHGFRALGLTLSIDDFGTGYSSLNYLKKFPIQTLKIDRSFVHDLGCDSDDNAIVKATIAMASSLNLKVIAEGVENNAQLNALKAYDCQEAQGYYFAKPMSSQAFMHYMQEEGERLSGAECAL